MVGERKEMKGSGKLTITGKLLRVAAPSDWGETLERHRTGGEDVWVPPSAAAVQANKHRPSKQFQIPDRRFISRCCNRLGIKGGFGTTFRAQGCSGHVLTCTQDKRRRRHAAPCWPERHPALTLILNRCLFCCFFFFLDKIIFQITWSHLCFLILCVESGHGTKMKPVGPELLAASSDHGADVRVRNGIKAAWTFALENSTCNSNLVGGEGGQPAFPFPQPEGQNGVVVFGVMEGEAVSGGGGGASAQRDGHVEPDGSFPFCSPLEQRACREHLELPVATPTPARRHNM